MPKRIVDLMSCEMLRGVRVSAKDLEYVTFKVPRKSGTFQQDLYPDCRNMTAAMEFDEYWGGADKDPTRMQLKPE